MLSERFTRSGAMRLPSKVAYERHNERVRPTVAPEPLVDGNPGDGWARLCAGTGTAGARHRVPARQYTSESARWMGLPRAKSRKSSSVGPNKRRLA